MRTLLLLVFVCVAAVAALAPLHGIDSKTAVKDQYLVVFHKNSSSEIRDFHVAELKARRFRDGDVVLSTFSIGNLHGYAAKLTKETLASELEHPNIRYIEQDQVVTIFDELADPIVVQHDATWGLDRIDHGDLPINKEYHYFESAGAGVTAYVIDTGIYNAHSDFEGRSVFGFSAIAGETPDADLNGHGTHVAGTIGGKIYGVAKKVALVAVKVLSAGGSGTWEGVIQGIQWVTKHHTERGRDARSVANMSLGGGIAATVDEAVIQSILAGIHYAIAAGNSYGANSCSYSPARVPDANTVGSTNSLDRRSSFSNVGSCIDLFAPGESITSAWIGNPTAISTISGTSMASPHVCGAMAVHLGHVLRDGDVNPVSPKDMTTFLTTQASKDRIPTADIPAGTPNLLLFSPSAY